MSAPLGITRGDMIVTRWGARFHGRRIPCAIGKGGFSHAKREGDGATPMTALRLMGGGYRADRRSVPKLAAKAALRMVPIGPLDLWSDDARDANYNHAVRAPYIYSHEKLRRADPLYDVFLITDWNWPDAVPGAGSAIFVHQWRKPRHPTEGCIAFRAQDLNWILARWQPHNRIVVKA